MYGLSAQIKFLNAEEVNEKKFKKMFKWISGDIEETHETKKWKKYLLYPDDYKLKIWTYIVLVLFVYTTLIVPFKLAFI